jgi:hypothetical protein
MKKNIIIMSIVGILIIVGMILFCYQGTPELQEFYYRLDEDTVKCIELNHKTNELVLSNWSEDLGRIQWVGTYEIKGNKLLDNIEGLTKAEWIIKDNTITTNILTGTGEYQDITYTAGTKEDFNKLVEEVKNNKTVELTQKPIETKEPVKTKDTRIEVELKDDGNYFVGKDKDILPGVYDIKLLNGDYGTVMSTDDNGFFASLDKDNEIYKNVELFNDMKIEVYGVDVIFIPK